MEETVSTYTINHPSKKTIMVPPSIAQKYDFFNANTLWHGQKAISFSDHSVRHINQFFDILHDKPTSSFMWRYWPKASNTIMDNDVEPLYNLNEYVSCGNSHQKIFLATAIANKLKDNPNQLYNNLPLLTLYESIFDSVDPSTKKTMAMHADDSTIPSSLCCTLYKVMYNPRLSSLWHRVTVSNKKISRDDPNAFINVLAQWKKQDPARRLFGKLMDSLGYISSAEQSIKEREYNTYDLLFVIDCINSLHNFDQVMYSLFQKVQGRYTGKRYTGRGLYLSNTFDRLHMPLITIFWEYLDYADSSQTIDAMSCIQQDKESASIRNFYTVDAYALKSEIITQSFTQHFTIDCKMKYAEGLQDVPKEKNIQFFFETMPSNVNPIRKFNNNPYSFIILPRFARLKTFATWVGILSVCYGLHKLYKANTAYIAKKIDTHMQTITPEICQGIAACKTLGFPISDHTDIANHATIKLIEPMQKAPPDILNYIKLANNYIKHAESLEKSTIPSSLINNFIAGCVSICLTTSLFMSDKVTGFFYEVADILHLSWMRPACTIYCKDT
jgi:hypothetical protein